jgi:hypothetical protein
MTAGMRQMTNPNKVSFRRRLLAVSGHYLRTERFSALLTSPDHILSYQKALVDLGSASSLGFAAARKDGIHT